MEELAPGAVGDAVCPGCRSVREQLEQLEQFEQLIELEQLDARGVIDVEFNFDAERRCVRGGAGPDVDQVQGHAHGGR